MHQMICICVDISVMYLQIFNSQYAQHSLNKSHGELQEEDFIRIINYLLFPLTQEKSQFMYNTYNFGWWKMGWDSSCYFQDVGLLLKITFKTSCEDLTLGLEAHWVPPQCRTLI